MPDPRRVVLRDIHDGPDHRHLEAHLDDAGALHIDGHDLGPGTALASDDGEYEWFQTVQPHDVSPLLRALGAEPDADVLTALAAAGAEQIEAVLRSGIVPVDRQVWGG